MGLHSSNEDDVADSIPPLSKGSNGGGVARKKAESTLERRRLGATHDQSAAQDCQNAMPVGELWLCGTYVARGAAHTSHCVCSVVGW